MADYAAYYRHVRGSLERSVAGAMAGDAYSEPIEHCEICRSRRHCEERRRADEFCVRSEAAVVLIVEDASVRLHAAEIIEAAGFDAVEASNADEAIAILEARRDIAVLFTDIQMPGSMDGLKLAAAVKGADATSGLVNVRPDDLPEGGRFLPKPYDPVQLTATLREIA